MTTSLSTRPRGRAFRLIWDTLCLGLPGVFILIPLGAFVIYSFWHNEQGQTVREFTLENYLKFFTDTSFQSVYWTTLGLCLGAAVLNVGIGFIIALFISRRIERLRFVLILAFLMPLFTSFIIKIYSIRSILGHRGVLNEILISSGLISEPVTALIFSRSAIFICFIVLYLPFAVLPIYLSIDRIPKNLFEASADLGGSIVDEIRRVVLPLSTPGLIVAALFSFVMTFGDFVTPAMVGGVDGFTFGRIVFTQFGVALNWPLGAALAVIMLVTTLLVVSLAALASKWSNAQ
ncbi:MAG: ABC transporter permease [Aestuariivirga sp.]